MMLPPRIKVLLLAGMLLASQPVLALDFRSVSETGTVFFAAPSESSTRLFVVSRQYPVEVVDEAPGWARVRDARGQLAWVQSARLSSKRYVLVATRTALRQAATDSAPLVAQVEPDVVLELLEPPTSLWARVRHDGKTTAFIRVQDIWGI